MDNIFTKLSSEYLITSQNIMDIKTYILKKYPYFQPNKSTSVFANTLNKIISSKLTSFSIHNRISIMKHLYRNNFSNFSSITMKDLLDACLDIEDDNENIIKEFIHFSEEKLLTSFTKEEFYVHSTKHSEDLSAQNFDDGIRTSIEILKEEELRDESFFKNPTFKTSFFNDYLDLDLPLDDSLFQNQDIDYSFNDVLIEDPVINPPLNSMAIENQFMDTSLDNIFIESPDLDYLNYINKVIDDENSTKMALEVEEIDRDNTVNNDPIAFEDAIINNDQIFSKFEISDIKIYEDDENILSYILPKKHPRLKTLFSKLHPLDLSKIKSMTQSLQNLFIDEMIIFRPNKNMYKFTIVLASLLVILGIITVNHFNNSNNITSIVNENTYTENLVLPTYKEALESSQTSKPIDLDEEKTNKKLLK